MDKKYGADAAKRIFATTDKARGALKELSDEKGYETFVVPDESISFSSCFITIPHEAFPTEITVSNIILGPSCIYCPSWDKSV